MNIRDAGAGDRSLRALAAAVVTQPFSFIEGENCFLHQSLLDAHHPMRAVVVMNRRFLSGPPTKDQHLDCVVATNAVSPVVAFLESDIRLQLELGDLDCRKPGSYFLERRWGRLAVESFDQRGKRECTGVVERLGDVSSFGVDLCDIELAPNRGRKFYIRLDRR